MLASITAFSFSFPLSFFHFCWRLSLSAAPSYGGMYIVVIALPKLAPYLLYACVCVCVCEALEVFRRMID